MRSGKVRYIAGSTMSAYKFAQMCMLAAWKGYAKPIAMQNLYNMVQREEEREMNRLCLEQGVGLIPYSPLARGFLAGNRSREGGGETERAKTDSLIKADTWRDCDWTIVEALKDIARKRGCKPTQAARCGCGPSPTWPRRSSAPRSSINSMTPLQPPPCRGSIGRGDRGAREALSVPRVAGELSGRDICVMVTTSR